MHIYGILSTKPIQNKASLKNIPVKTELSKKISIDLKIEALSLLVLQ